jgi:hypothetical protein
MRIRTIIAAAAAPAALAAVLLGTAGQASAASAATTAKPVTVTANTHVNNHADTTDLCSVGKIGPDCVWAYDNATEKFTAVQDLASDSTGQTWQVTMDYVGSFHGFADPTTGAPLTSDGPVKGTISYTVNSPNVPNPALLSAQSTSGISANITALFGGTPTITGGNTYSFSYQNGSYVQETAGSHGDVTGH